MTHTVFPDGYDSYFRSWEARIGAFLEFSPDPPACPLDSSVAVEPSLAAAVADLPFAVKDNIAVEGFGLTCGSRLLEKFRSPYSSTVVKRLMCAGAIAVGKTNLDEFGMGSSTDNSSLKVTNNPWDTKRVPGGSSGGSAAAVAAGLVPFALGSDTGGSVRQPASFCGVVGLKPTYGAVSRFGLVAYASSLETIGIVADSAVRARQAFAVMRAVDPLDQTTKAAPVSAPSLATPPVPGKGPKRVIGVLSPEAATLEGEVERAFKESREALVALGHTLVDISLPSLKYAVPAYYTIATAEASANLARFDGIRYGQRPEYSENPEDLIDKSRGAGFGDEVKLRILLGTFVLRSGFQDQYYLRAQRIRAAIRADFDRVFQKIDALLLPVFPTRAFGRGDAGLTPFAQKAADVFTCCANMAGLPALAFPTGVEGGLPTGVQLMGRAFEEGLLFELAEAYEAGHPIAHPAGYRAFWS